MDNKTILIVEDDSICRECLRDLFEMEGFNCLEACGGIEALKVIKANKGKVDLVISDIRMPNGNGIQLLMEVKAIDSTFPPVILITGFSNQKEISLMKKGAECVLDKPIEFRQLFQEVEKTIDKYKAV